MQVRDYTSRDIETLLFGRIYLREKLTNNNHCKRKTRKIRALKNREFDRSQIDT